MTVAQALRRVKKLKGIIAEHRTHAINGVSYASDKVPSFRFHEELVAMGQATDDMVDLESRIAIANATATVQDDPATLTLAKAVRLLQEIKGTISFYQSLSLKSGLEKNRNMEWDDGLDKTVTRVEETTYVTDLTEQERARRVKILQDHFESLNNSVEDANHQVTV